MIGRLWTAGQCGTVLAMTNTTTTAALNLRPWQVDHITAQRTAATWYAYGRNDAGSVHVDPQAFAEHYAELLTLNLAGRSTFLPSIERAWNLFTTPAVECIVIAGTDGPTLWDCECPECRQLQREAP